MAYGLGVLQFTVCRDARMSDLWRRAVLERLDRCPFSAATKRDFHWEAKRLDAEIARMTSTSLASDGKIVVQGDGVHDKVDIRQSCEQEPGYSAWRDQLERYAAGEISVAEVVPAPDDCHYELGGP